MTLGKGIHCVTKIRISRQYLVKNYHSDFKKSAQRRYAYYLIYA
jgi:hypothetical protein